MNLKSGYKKDAMIFTKTKKDRIRKKVMKRLFGYFDQLIDELGEDENSYWFKFVNGLSDYRKIDENAPLKFQLKYENV